VTLNVYNPIHLSQAVIWSRIAKLSADHESMKQLNCSLLFASPHNVQMTSVSESRELRRRVARCYAVRLAHIENVRAVSREKTDARA
jgi:hypothetical protein